jgi:adenylate cyclase
VAETRRLAAILATDVVGFSRMTGADEDRTLARLRALRSDLLDPTIAVHNGRVFKRTGDGALVEFRSVVDAVRCAIEVQNAMVERNAGVPPEQRIDFRMGIHLGDVVEEGDGDLMGDGINIAARLEGIAHPGMICLSEDAYRQVKARLDLEVLDLGATRLKNIAEPIHVYSLQAGAPAQPKLAQQSQSTTTTATPHGLSHRWMTVMAVLCVASLAVGAYFWHSGLALRTPGASIAEDKFSGAPRLSIVVLPFSNLSSDPEQDYFADAITDDLSTDLSHLADSFVIARNTAFTYKGNAADVKEIGRELGVRYVLEGSVRRVGETITINAQLISTETGAHVWADRFDGLRSQLGQLQVEVVARLARSLDVELVRAESLRTMRERPSNPDAIDLAMQGSALLNQQRSPANVNEAGDYFEHALRLDPKSPRALMGLSLVLSSRASSFWSGNRAEDLACANDLADQALAILPDNAWTHVIKALALTGNRQWDAALGELNSALEYDRNLATAYADSGFWQIFIGHADRGFAPIQTAFRLSITVVIVVADQVEL